MKRRLLYLIPVAILLVVGAAFLIGLGRDPKVLPSALIGQPVPAFDLPPLLEDVPGLSRDDLIAQAAAEGPVLVNFFASWCVPCRAEHALLSRLTGTDGIAIDAVAWKDKAEAARAWLAALGNPYVRIGHDPDNRAGIEFGVYGVPETYVIDRGGNIRLRQAGPITPEIWQRDFVPLLAELRQ